jgi:hypothetical protein
LQNYSLFPFNYSIPNRGVYQARALLTVFDTIGTEYTSYCDGQPYERHMVNENSTEESEPVSHVLIYPNPTRDLVNVEYVIEGTISSSSINIYDLMGKEIYEGTLIGNSGTLVINTSNFKGGIYLVRISNVLGVLNQERLVILK